MIAALRVHMYIVVLASVIVFGSWTSIAHAESVLWSAVYPANLWLHPPPIWQPVIASPYMQVQYGARALNTATGENLCGGSVAVGTSVTFQFTPHVWTDVSWSGTGFSIGTPYGGWATGGGYPVAGGSLAGLPPGDQNLCQSPYYYSTTNYPMYAAFSVAPPEQSAMIDAVFSCESAPSDGTAICTATSPAHTENTFVFKPTSGHFWWGYDDGGRHAGYPLCLQAQLHGSTNIADLFTQPVSQQSISCPITVNDAEGEPPAAPSLAATGNAFCIVGQPYTISMNATDPDNNPIRYGIDWDADGSVDQFVPPSGYVPSGTSQSANRTYTTSGTKTVKVYTQDQGGLSSPWTTVSFSCSQPATTQCADGVDNDGDGLMDQNDPDCSSSSDLSEFSSIPSASAPPAGLPTANLRLTVPSLIARGKTVQVTWSADNVASCNPVIGTNGDSFPHLTLGDTFYSPVGGRTSSDITGRTTYTLSCIDLNGTPHTKTATVNIAPRVRER